MILWQLNLPENPPTAADAHCRMQTAIFKAKMGGDGVGLVVVGGGWWVVPSVAKKIFQMLTENKVMQRCMPKFAGSLTQWL